MNRLIRFVLIAFIACFIASGVRAKVGDTTHVTVVDKHLWSNFPGTVDSWAAFPAYDTAKHYEKVLLRYRLTCPSPSCGQWDYTTKVILRKHTGIIDSVLKDAPNFTVNGNVVDSFVFSRNPTKSTSYNSTKKKTDTTVNAPVTIYIYQNFVNPWKAIDSVTVWPAGYWNFLYDNTGAKTDSAFVAGDSVYHVTKVKAYFRFERTIDYEIARYITPYGQGFPTNWTYVWTMDVTDYAFMLHDSCEFISTYDGYTKGSLYSLSFDMIEGSPARETYRVDRLYDGYYPYGNTADPISNYVKPVKVWIDPNADIVTFRTFTTGHGNAGPSAAAEFLERTHSIWIDSVKRYDQHLWRTDCMFNPAYPQTGTWTLSRAGWCPGDKVDPWDFDLTQWKKGDSEEVDYRFQDYNVSGGGYAVHAQAIYSKGPKYNNDVALMEIEAPTNEGPYRRTNPICSEMSPIIDIRNNGKDDLTSLTIRYGIDSAFDHTYQWTGTLKYYQTAVIDLPGIDLGTGTHSFNVRLDAPNGKQSDDYPNNNVGVSTYAMPKLYSNIIKLQLKVDDLSAAGLTNGISYEVVDANDNVLYYQGGLDDGALVRDTFKLATGCYRFIIFDSSDIPQGLYPWFIQGATSGYYNLRDDKNATIWNATTSNNLASFGGREIIPFMVQGPSSVAVTPLANPLDFTIFPNPAHEHISLDLSSIGSFTGEMRVSVFSVLGHELITRTIRSSDLPRLDLDMHHYPAGTYIVRLEYGNTRISKRCILQ